MPVHDPWPGVARHLRASVSSQEYETWFAPLAMRLEESRAVFTVPNRFFAEWIAERYSKLLNEALNREMGRSLDAAFEISPEQVQAKAAVIQPPPPKTAPAGINLNGAYTFDSFVVGPCNELAHAACQAVADAPGGQYNPLMIFGGSGLGKTHLVSAVANRLVNREPAYRVHYTSSEAYSNELIQAVRFDGIQSFRDKYRRVDSLIIEDIQFLSGRERTQEEFFHTFDALFQAGRQIVLTSDKLPRDIPGLASRLRTRFEWGLLADLQTPDTETKLAILQRKATEKGVVLSRQVAMFLARRLTNASFPEIGQALGGKDHSTVVKGVQRVEKLLVEDPELADTVRAVENAIRQGKQSD